MKNGKLTQQDLQMLQAVLKVMNGAEMTDNGLVVEKDDKGNDIITGAPKIADFLATPSAKVLMPKVIIGAMREVSEPMYIASNFFEKIKFKGAGNSMVFPSVGTIARAYDIAEGQEIPEESMDWQTHEGTEVKVGKSGLRLRFTSEMISDSQWDIISMMIKAAGRAMARHKEKKAFTAFRNHGHTIFDNKDARPELHTSGRDVNGALNNTLAAEDLLDIIIALMGNGFDPSNLLMHPLAWTVFARNELTGGLFINNQMGGLVKAKEYPKGGSFKLGPDSIQGRLPFQFGVDLSPFATINKKEKTFDITCLDKNNVGVLLEKQKMETSKFLEPARDLENLKITERYGLGILNEGRGVVTAKNISMSKSYPEVLRVKEIK